ncbi:hypothetical protein OSH11_21085 [Kaistia dalseonensis]|uniref:Uncharacterized protein n=1 Tax=Kaistia dalseonensis TaxID=410840 RepID=A0ABU0HEB2_9HYPH|nr:hypothetical protein [Kaistia dalseonensis]MCX5497210.1 hypothetical protein [Kaistia dalseonensis]MDQ0439841.1 hypothetical protein [Kaistia dalseonensis]
MTATDQKPTDSYANTDEQQGGFSNADDNIRRQQSQDLADDRQNGTLPDPAGERHAPDVMDERLTDGT